MTVAKPISLLMLVLLFQQTKNVLYVESWKKGRQQIQEQKLLINLDSNSPKFKAKIKDASGKESYRLELDFTSDKERKEPSSAYVSLNEKGLIGFNKTNILKPSNDPYQDYFTSKDHVAILDPAMQCDLSEEEDGCVPFLVKRVIKVKGFYCIVQVTDYKPSEGKWAGSMIVQVEFTNRYEEK